MTIEASKPMITNGGLPACEYAGKSPYLLAQRIQQSILAKDLQRYRSMSARQESLQDWPAIGQFLDLHMFRNDAALASEGRTSGETLLAWKLHSRHVDAQGNVWMLVPTSKLKVDWARSQGSKKATNNACQSHCRQTLPSTARRFCGQRRSGPARKPSWRCSCMMPTRALSAAGGMLQKCPMTGASCCKAAPSATGGGRTKSMSLAMTRTATSTSARSASSATTPRAGGPASICMQLLPTKVASMLGRSRDRRSPVGRQSPACPWLDGESLCLRPGIYWIHLLLSDTCFGLLASGTDWQRSSSRVRLSRFWRRSRTPT